MSVKQETLDVHTQWSINLLPCQEVLITHTHTRTHARALAGTNACTHTCTFFCVGYRVKMDRRESFERARKINSKLNIDSNIHHGMNEGNQDFCYFGISL